MYRSISPRRTHLRRPLAPQRPPVCPAEISPARRAVKVFAHPDRPPVASLAPVRFDPVASPASLAGSTPHFHVYYASILGQGGNQIAQAALKNCERDYKTLADFFGQQQSLIFNVVLAPLSAQMDGSGGAYHHGCGDTDLYCDVQITPNIDPDVTNALIVAEEVEVFEALQNEGWGCGGTNGEGLSRVLAAELYPNVLESLGYSTARFWLDSPRPNLVRRTLPTDQSMIGNGCAVLFLNYLHVQLGFSWNQICQAGAPTLARTYHKLTDKTGPFHEFAKLLEKKFPQGEPIDLETDNPFPIKEARPAAAEKVGNKPKMRDVASDTTE